MDPWTFDWKERKLRQLRREWDDCRKCALHEERTSVVLGAGNPDADVMFVGEAPGSEEDKTGDPFVGPSGMILRSMWEGAGQSWEDVYTTNLVACRPPGTPQRSPVNDEKNPCFERLQEQIYIIDPLLLIAVGKQAMQYLIGGRAISIEDKHGKLLSPGAKIGGVMFPRTDDTKKTHHLTYNVVPIYHPAYILRRDSYNDATDTFEPGGIADKTFADINMIVERVERMKEIHAELQPEIDRRMSDG